MENQYPDLSKFSKSMNVPKENLVRALEIERHFHSRIQNETSPEVRRDLYKEVYSAVHPLYEKKSFSASATSGPNPKTNIVKLFKRELAGKSILDVGCGQGYFLKKIAECLPHKQLTGIDNSIQVLPNSNEIQFLQRDVIEFSLADKYDIIFSDNVIEHIAPIDLPTHLASIGNALADDGKFILIMPNRLFGPTDVTRIVDFSYTNRVPAQGTHLNESTYTEMIEILSRSGFKKFSTVLPIVKLKYVIPGIRISPRPFVWLESSKLLLNVFYRIPLLRMLVSNLSITLICEK